MALMELAGKELPPAVLMNHVMISPSNVCEYYESRECAEDRVAFEYSFPEDAFKTHVASLREERRGKLFQAYMQEARKRFPVQRRPDALSRVTG